VAAAGQRCYGSYGFQPDKKALVAFLFVFEEISAFPP
jgi:hypothetical protein